MKKLLFLLMLMLLPTMAMADAVEIGGIFYNLIDKGNAAEVTKRPNGQYTGDITIPEKIVYNKVEYSVNRIGYGAFNACKGLTSILIPNSVTYIGDSSFAGCLGLTSIFIPNSVTSIGKGCFYGCSGLSSIEIPSSVTLIESETFRNCSGLTSIIIPYSVTTIAEYAFVGCSSLESIFIPDNVTSIGTGAFMDCTGLVYITVSNNVTAIGPSAFDGCSALVSFEIPTGMKELYNSTFKNCSNLSTITIPDNITAIGGSVFYNCSSLKTLTFPENLTSIGKSALYGCSSLTDIIIPNNVTIIDGHTFSHCSSLVNITIGAGVNTIRTSAFGYCPEIKDVYCLSDNCPDTDKDAFNESYIEYATLRVPDASVNLYKVSEPWKNFKKIVGLSTGDGTVNKPFSPSEASEYVQSLEAGVPSDKDFYIYGKISLIKNEFTTRYGNATFYISENGGTDEPQFLIYRTLYLGNRDFLEGDENIKVGDEVVVCGKVINYNGTTPETYEKASYLYSLNGTFPKCATPVITLEGNKLKFSCDTEGVTFHYDITVNGSLTGQGEEMEIPDYISYPVTAYASKAGYQNSDVARMDLPRCVSLRGDANGDGVVTISDAVEVVNIIMGKDE